MKVKFNSDRIVSFHPRRQHNFEQAACLTELYPGKFKHVTSIYFPPFLVRILSKIVPRYASQIGKRSYHKLGKKYVITLPSTEFKKFFAGRKHELHPSDFLNLNENWQKTILQRFEPPGVCISYDGISHLLFRKWKTRSKLILDLAIGLPQYRIKIMQGDQFHIGMLDDMSEYHRKLFACYKEEVELADIILCGSEFVKKTVVYFFPEFGNKCWILPYGTELNEFDYPERRFQQKEDLKFVFVGRLSWRKGTDFLLDAWKDFTVVHPRAELHLFGAADKEIILDPLPDNVFIHGRLKTPELIVFLKEMDVFVFPTTFEGSSIAVFQAMASKLPVITTLNSGTILQHGQSCEIIEAGDRAGLLNAMEKLFYDLGYRQKLAESAHALSKHYTWEDYKLRLTRILQEAAIY
ncbi:MAG: glycosyltransferase family 4 protein [Bacteroidota bacterium]|nr:glycosyltransferase family 4 protein [Bacteroidota bacterium]